MCFDRLLQRSPQTKTMKSVHFVLCVTVLLTFAAAAAGQDATGRLQAEGRWLVDEAGERVTLHGANVWSYRGPPTSRSIGALRRNIAFLKDTEQGLGYANFARLAVHSINICDDDEMREHVDTYVAEAVTAARAQGLYILIEPHYFPGDDNQYVPCDDDQEQNYVTNDWWLRKIKTFWAYAGPKFKDEPHVLYGVTNEPVRPENCPAIHGFMQELVDFIRERAPETLISVQSYTWTNNADCWTVPQYRIDDANVLYEAHVYPWNPSNRDGDPAVWTERIGRAAEHVPVLIGEFGPEDAQDELQWQQRLKQWMDGYPNLSWAAWCLDCNSSMEIIDCDWNITDWGRTLKRWLREEQTGEP